MADDPIALFDAWFTEAQVSEPNDPNAMALATADADGRPSCRMVLLKGHGPDGFVFYTNQQSRKADEITANPHVALLFHWKSLRRQVRIEGNVTHATDAESDAYFASRSRESQLAAVASDQSRPLDSHDELIARYEAETARWAGGAVPRPSHWGGYRVVPRLVEFWQDGPHRLHERRTFTLLGSKWFEGRLYP